MIPYKLPTKRLTYGDKWKDVYHFGPMVDENGAPPGTPCLSCSMLFREKNTGSIGYELTSVPTTGKGTIAIVDATHYEFDIPEQSLPLGPGTWLWEFKTFESAGFAGSPQTFLCGEFEVVR